MLVRAFNGIGDKIVTEGLGIAIGDGPYTLVEVVKPTTFGSDEAYSGYQNGASHLIGSMVDGGGTGRLGNNTFNNFALAEVGVTAGDVQILVNTRAADGTTGFHRTLLDSDTWTHAAGGTLGDDAAICDRIEHGAFLNGGFLSPKDCRKITSAALAAELSEADIESIRTNPTSQHLLDLGAIYVVDFDQASIATPVVDLVGGAAQVVITGTSVVDDADFDGWTPGVVTPPSITVAPAITGVLEAGETLTCSSGTWHANPAPAFTYQWERDDEGGGVWSEISGQTAATHLLTTLDMDCMIRCVVTATNTEGTDDATSNEVGPIGPPPPLVFTLRLSGGASNTDPTTSIGGIESSHLMTPALLHTISGAQGTSGHIDYRLVYVHNDDTLPGTVSVWLDPNLNAYPGNANLAFAVATEASGDTVTAIANETTAPAGVSFTQPDAAGELSMGTIAPGDGRGLWVRRTTPEDTDENLFNEAFIWVTVTPV